MSNCPLKVCRSSLTKGLTAIMLFFSLFVFSGYATATQSVQQEPVRTETYVPIRQLVGRHNFLWLSFAIHASSGNISRLFPAAEENALLADNRPIKIWERHILRACLAIEKPLVFFPVKSIPESTSEYFLSSCRG